MPTLDEYVQELRDRSLVLDDSAKELLERAIAIATEQCGKRPLDHVQAVQLSRKGLDVLVELEERTTFYREVHRQLGPPLHRMGRGLHDPTPEKIAAFKNAILCLEKWYERDGSR